MLAKDKMSISNCGIRVGGSQTRYFMSVLFLLGAVGTSEGKLTLENYA
jgi:hypothetical protein